MYGRGIFEWLTLDMAVFVILNVFLIMTYGDSLAQLRGVTVLEFLVLGLASYRAANILSTEVITKPLRSPFVDEIQQDGKIVEKPKPAGFLGSVGLIIYCPSCTGVWIAAVFTYAFVFWPTATFTIAVFFALSGMERIISTTLARLRSG